jgi:hypothetical protein
MSLMNVPLDLVKHILTYDQRFILRNGKIITIGKLNKVAYKDAIKKIKSRPIILTSSNVNGSTNYFRSFVRFSDTAKNLEIEYTNYNESNDIYFRIYKHRETQYKIILP